MYLLLYHKVTSRMKITAVFMNYVIRDSLNSSENKLHSCFTMHSTLCLTEIKTAYPVAYQQDTDFNPLSTILYLSDLKSQFVLRSKHSLPQLQKPLS